MPEPQGNGAFARQPTNREELIRYLEAVVRLTDNENSTAGFLLRLVLSTLGGASGLVRRPTP
jgi:hypothetical protein